MWLATWTIVTLQQYLPLNPDGIGNMEPTLAFNTISSFVTNTNLQHYSGETGLSYSLADVRDHVPAVRDRRHGRRRGRRHHPRPGGQPADARSATSTWISTRASVRVFLPLALLVSVLMMWQGTPMTFEGAAKATTVEGQEQTIARGVTAGVVSIKQLGTNGGGYFGPNSTHPVREPDAARQLHRDAGRSPSSRCRWW